MRHWSITEATFHWMGWENGQEPEDTPPPTLPHLSDQEILGLADGYDDGRIDTLVEAFVKLREKYWEMTG